MAKYHQSLRTIPVYDFYEILFSGDYSLLYIDEKGKEDLQEVWQKMKDEYYRLSKVNNRDLRRIAEVEEKRSKHDKITLLLLLVCDEFTQVREEATKALKDYGYVFDENKSFDEEMERMIRSLKVLKTKIAIEEDKLPKKAVEKPDLIKEALALENIFPNRTIDIYTYPMEKWLSLQKMAEEKIKAQKQ